MCIAAAIIGGAVVGGGATMIAGGEAASATTEASNKAIAAQQQATQQEQALQQPYLGAGGQAVGQLSQLLGLTGPGGVPGGGNSASIQQTLSNMPGYQFTMNQAMQQAQNSAASQGMLHSGNTLSALQSNAAGLADQTYQQQVGDLQSLSGLGQAAAAGQAANVQGGAQNIGNIATNQGNNMAGIYANEAAGIANAAGGAANQYIEYNTLKNLMNSGGGAGPG
jgi:hypothetical protein